MPDAIIVATFYKFVALPDYRELRLPLLTRCQNAQLRGTILLAPEGINATIAGSRQAIDALLAYLRADPRLADLKAKESSCAVMPFGKMKARLKREIVALKQPGIDPNQRAGEYIDPQDWNALVTQDDVLLIDARNQYEVEIGTFANAIDPGTESFHELPGFFAERLDASRHKRIAMFCTGGIRCEKASAYLLGQGFEAVYQLRGGILSYLENVPRSESLWQGECFVFDERVSLDHELRKGRTLICDDCKATLSADDTQCPGCGSSKIL